MGKKKWPASQPRHVQQQMASGHPSVTELTLQQRHFKGPLPPPECLAEYDQITPGFADRIITMAEKEQTERHADRRVMRAQQGKLLSRGQVFAFIICLIVILGGILLILQDKPTAGFVAIITGVATVVLPFLYRTARIRQQRIEGAAEEKKD